MCCYKIITSSSKQYSSFIFNSSFQNLFQKLAQLLYEAADRGYLDPGEVLRILQVSKEEVKGVTQPTKEADVKGTKEIVDEEPILFESDPYEEESG